MGLDIGTDSVGYCVTDMEYNVMRKGKKNLIGTRLFESGETAEERRVLRSNRRRLARRKERVQLLQGIFMEEIMLQDPDFFLRLKEGMYHSEDKSVCQNNTLFNDLNYVDKNYHEQYKTIYHLRKALMMGEVDDIRLLYLGIEHILKHRGHFLFQGIDFGEISNFINVYKSMNEVLDGDYDGLKLNIEDVQQLENILKDKNSSQRQKEYGIQQLMDAKPSIGQKEFIKLLIGGSVSLKKLFGEQSLEEELHDKKLSFKNKFEEEYPEIEGKLDEKSIIIELAKAIYDWSVLVDILSAPQKNGVPTTISDAKIHTYDLHKEELAMLKEMVREYIPTEYKEIFQASDKEVNYATYIGMTMKNKRKIPIVNKACSEEDLCKYLLKKFNGIEDEIVNPEHIAIIDKLKLNILLPKQRVKENGVIPYQVNLTELNKILEVNKDKFPFLTKEQNGYVVSDKIESIFLYRIPYYVGPLNQHSEHAWIVKKSEMEGAKIYPWNFNEIVDKEESAECFIRRMTNECTYLKGKDVIPQKSILYSRYMVLNELNNLKIDGNKLPVEIKQELYHNVFEREKKVTQAKVKAYLRKISYASKDMVLTGIDGDFKSSLESYIAFKSLLGEDYDEGMVENLIKWIVLFSDDKALLQHKIDMAYPQLKVYVRAISKLKYSGWGKFSKEFLTTVYAPDHETGEAISIIRALYETNLNLMQLLSSEYEYRITIDSMNGISNLEQIKYDDIKDLYCSPAVKKSIWQSVQIVQEVEKIMQGTPEKLFVEVTRAEGEKIRSNSRKRELMNSYKIIKNEYAQLYNTLDGMDESRLRQKKIFLYFTQLGRCAYTGRTIELEDLNNGNLYDIEHIYPQSITKDDSIHNNLVLVYRSANAKKSNIYPIPGEYRQEMLWKLWHDKKLITKTKYDRLMRITPFEPRELEGFIARQLVETSQSSKAVAELFGQYYQDKNAKVVYVKAGNVSLFRKHFDIIKVREINDYHHAHDAYLNIVVGNIWDTKFTTKFFKQITTNQYSLKPEVLYGRNIGSDNNYAWIADDNRSIAVVKNTIAHAKILFTRHSYEQTGKFYDETIYKKGNGERAVKNPLQCDQQDAKLMDLQKYGGYKSVKGAYFCVVEHTAKKKRIRTIEFVPIYLASQIRNNEKMLEEYLEQQLQLEEIQVIVRKLKIGALLNVDGMPMHLSGRTGDRVVFRGAAQLQMDSNQSMYYKQLVKFDSRRKENASITLNERDGITAEENIQCYEYCIDKLEHTIYKKFFAAQAKTLIDKRDIFTQTSLKNQVRILVNILSIFKCNAVKCDLSLLGAGKNVGTLLISKIISNKSSVKLINQSVTGIYQNEMDLLG